MTAYVEATEAPDRVLEAAGSFLAGDPVSHNVILTLLHGLVADPSPGRFWIVYLQGHPAGVVFQSPLHFVATITPMAKEATGPAVDAIVSAGVELPGIVGEAATAAHFAGHWAERTKRPAHPTQGQRIYEVDEVIVSHTAPGGVRPAAEDDRAILVDWLVDFYTEAGQGAGSGDPERAIGRRLSAGQLWVWQDRGPVAMAAATKAAAGVVRIGPVYTPPDQRRRGYGSALVGAVSRGVRADGYRCILYTDLANPTSNAIYRAIGYKAVAEVLRYSFEYGS